MYAQAKNRAAFIMVELCIAMFIMGLMLAALAISLDSYASFNDYLLTRQRCTAAAEAQLDSIAILGRALSDEDVHRLWPNVRISNQRSAGRDQWNGLTLVKITAEAKSRRKTVHIELSRYVMFSKGLQ